MTLDCEKFIKAIGDFWKWFSKHYKAELHKDDLEDLFWANAVNDMEEILKKYGEDKTVINISRLCLSEMSDIKDWNKTNTQLVLYYNAFIDCTKILKEVEKGFDYCDGLKKQLYAKYKGNKFTGDLFDLTMEKIANG